MNSITTKRNFRKFYLPIIFGVVFFWALGAFMIYMFVDPIERAGLKHGGAFLMPLFGIALIFLGLYTIYQYFKNAPVIEVDSDKISFNRETLYWKDIRSITLTGKQPFRYILNFPMEGAVLVFNEGKVKYIFDDVYSNGWQVKLFIQDVVINKSSSFELPDISVGKAEIESDYFDTFRGNQFTSLRGISLWGTLGIFAGFAFTLGNTVNTAFYIFFAAFAIFWLLFHSWLMHFFQVSSNLLVVRNHILFWRTHAYRLSDIKEIAFETRDKMPNCLRVITKDFRSKIYPAGTLRDKTWLLLKDKLESQDITVRNECI